MELTEVVSPHVAVPVVGVLLCAFLVFAFGFKTPGQPPSFNFEEDNKRKRSKKSKVALVTSNLVLIFFMSPILYLFVANLDVSLSGD